MREQPSDQIKEHNPHQRQKGAACQDDKKYLEIIPERTLFPTELVMNFVIGHLGRGPRMAFQIGADPALVVYMGNGIRILVAQHLVNRFTRLDVAVQAVGDSFIQKVGRLAVKGFAIGKYGSGPQVMPGNDFRVVVASAAGFGNVAWISGLLQPGGDVVVKSVYKLIRFMADPAAAQGGLGYTGTHPFEKGKRPVKRIIMTVLTGRDVFRKFFGLSILFGLGMHAAG